ncbi:MAG: hypothetical protein AB2L14_34745 [Candidatus Xenobiia bacterium LiM19]
MEKRAFAFHSAAELSCDEFAAVFLGDYASVVQKHQPGICRFSLDLPLQLIDGDALQAGTPPFSGLMWSWYKELQDAVDPGRLYASPDSAHIVVEVVETFLGGLEALRLEEHIVWEDSPDDNVQKPTAAIKQIFFIARSPDITSEEFRSRYRRYGETARDQLAGIGREHRTGVARYVQNIVLEAQGESIGNADAVSEIWFHSAEDAREPFYLKPGDSAEGPCNAADFIDFSALFSILVTEHVIKP